MEETSPLGTLKSKGIVYAELAKEKDDPYENWLKITFDTQALRDGDMEFEVGYVQYKAVEPLTNEQVAELNAKFESDTSIRREKNGKYYVPCVAFEEAEAAPTVIPEMADAPELEEDMGSDTPEASTPETKAERLGQTTANNVNVRIAATTQSDCVTTIEQAGTEVVVTGETEADGDVWYVVRFDEHIGYIRSDLVEIITENAAAQPEADVQAAAADVMLSSLSDAPAEESAATEIIGVWYDKGIEERPLQIHVTTSLDAQYLYLYQGDDLLASWQASEANIDESAASKEWHVSYTFDYSGAYYLWYKASADGTAMSDVYTPDPVEIERPAVIDVWYEMGIEGKPLKIHATTNLDMQYLYLYLGEDQLVNWSADSAEIVEYATCKEWIVEYTLADPGTYYLWYKASADGTEMSLPYAPAAAQIDRPAVIEVWYEKGLENTPLKIHATTNLQMQHLYLYLGENQLGNWSTEDAEIVEYATCKEWVIEHTFADPGAYYLWYKASEDGKELSQAYAPAAAQIERPAIIEVWYEEAVTGVPLKIHATTNLDIQHLYLYLGENQLKEWQAAEADIVDYATCKEWTVDYTFEDAGAYYLWYKASKDGATEELPFAPDPVYIEQVDDTPTPTPEPTATPTPEPTATPEPTLDPTAFSALISCDAKESFVGQAVTWTATAVNGVEPYKYLFRLYRNEKLLATRSYSDDPVYAYTFSETGEYYIVLSIKDDNRKVASVQSDTISVGLEKLMASEILCDLDSLQTTETATWTAAATGGQAPYTFKFALTKDSKTVSEQVYSATATFSYEFTDEGDYTLAVTVKDALGTESEAYELAVPVALRPLEITSLKADVSTSETEEAITWTVTATAGKAPYTYAFEVMADGVSQGKSKSQSENTYSYTPELAGTYKVIAYATDAYGNIAQMESSELVVTTKPLAVSTVAADRDWVKIGDTVTWTTTAIGGVKPLRYAFDVYVDGEELDGCEFTTNNTISYAPEMAGVYSVNALVRDAENTTVSVEGGEVTAYAQIAVDSVTADVNECLTGEPVTWTANVIGGKGTLNYHYEVYCADTLEYVTTSAKNTLLYAPMHSGMYTVKVRATDENSESSEQTGGEITVSLHDSSPVEDFTYSVLNGTYCSITGYKGTDEAVIVPDEIDGYIVQTIASNAFKGNTTLRSVVLPDSVNVINANAFQNCTNLLAIYAGTSLTTIYGYAFSGCSSLVDVELNTEKLTTIQSYAFAGCTALESIVLPDSIMAMNARAFNNCTKLASVNYPSSWTSVGDYAHNSATFCSDSGSYYCSPFTGCTKLTKLAVPEGVTTIPKHAFKEMTSLRNIDLPSTLLSINNYAFQGASGLTAIYIGPNVTTIGSNVFTNHNSDLVIYGEADSYAETYASEQGITFSTETMAKVYGSLSGTVVDEEGNAVSGVAVTLSPYGSYDVEFTAMTNDTGKWSISGIPVGSRYQANYSAEGYAFESNNPVYMAAENGRDVGTVVATTVDIAMLNSIRLSITEWTGGSEDAQRYFSVDSIGDWYVESVPEWATVYSQNAAEASTVRMRAKTVTTSNTEAVLILENNDDMTARSGELVISNGLTTATMSITQLSEIYDGMAVQFTFPEAASMTVDIPAELTLSVEAVNFKYGVLTVISPDGGTEEFEFSDGTAEIPYAFRTEGDYTIYATVYGNDVWLDAGDGEERPSAQTAEYTITCSNTSSESVATQISDAGFELIKSFEGFSATPYKDGKTNQKDDNGNVLYHYSIGYGCQIEGLYTADNPPEQTITREEASELLKKKIAVREVTANKYLDKYGITLNQSQYDAIMSICYNFTPERILGTDTQIRKMLIEYKNGSNIPAWKVYRTFVLYHHADGKDNTGLFQRRMTEANIFVKGDYNTRSWNYVTEGADGWFRVPDSDGVIRRGLDVPAEWYKDRVTDSLTLSATTLNVVKDGGEKSIAISGSTAWTARADSDWITVDRTSASYGMGNTLVMQIAENKNNSQRTGRIIVNDTKKNTSQILIVVQAGSESTAMSAAIVPFDIGYTEKVKIGRGATFITTASGGDGEYTYSFKVQKLDTTEEYVDYELASKYVSIQGGRIVVRADRAGLYRIVANVKDGHGQSAVAYGYFNVSGLDPIVYNADFSDGNYYDIDDMPTVRWEKISDAAYYRVKLVELAYAGTDNAHYVIPENGTASDEGVLVKDPSISLGKYTFKKSQTYRMWVGAFNSYGIRIAQSEWIFSTNPLQDIEIELLVNDAPVSGKVPLAQDVTISWERVEASAALNRETAYLRANVKDNTEGVWLQSVKENCDRMSPEQVSFIISSKELLPGHNYTLWLAAFTKEGARFAQYRVEFSVDGSIIWDDPVTPITVTLDADKANASARAYVNECINARIWCDREWNRNLNVGKAVVFLFEGAGADNSSEQRQYALCVVVKNNELGVPEIVYQNEYCTTLPDLPKKSVSSSISYVSTVRDGIYNIRSYSWGHGKTLWIPSVSTVRFDEEDMVDGKASSSSDILIHQRWWNDNKLSPIYNSSKGRYSVNSAGCILIGKKGSGTDSQDTLYSFLKAVNGGSLDNWQCADKGCVIVDRTLAKQYLIDIYGEEGAKKISPNI